MQESVAQRAFAGTLFENAAEMEGIGKPDLKSNFRNAESGVPKQVLRFRDAELLDIVHRRGPHNFFENKMEARGRKVDVPRKVFAGERISEMVFQKSHDGSDPEKTLD